VWHELSRGITGWISACFSIQHHGTGWLGKELFWWLFVRVLVAGRTLRGGRRRGRSGNYLELPREAGGGARARPS